MKKIFMLLLVVCMLATLTACGKEEKDKVQVKVKDQTETKEKTNVKEQEEEQEKEDETENEKGIMIVNGIGLTLEEIHIVTQGADEWGEPMFGQLEDGESATLFPMRTFNSQIIEADILAIDMDGDIYEVYNVPMRDGDICILSFDDDFNFVAVIGDASFIGQCSIDFEGDDEEIAYFDEMGYELNYEINEGSVEMTNGAYAFTPNGEYYCTIPATIWIERESYDDTQDGYIETTFTKTVYLDSFYFPSFIKEGMFDSLSITTRLYDYYTGYWLADGNTIGDSKRGDNHYYYEYESQGRTICVDYNYSTDWTKEEDGSYILKMQSFIRMPEDYDGIIYASLAAYPDYAAYLEGHSQPEGNYQLITDGEAEDAIFWGVNR